MKEFICNFRLIFEVWGVGLPIRIRKKRNLYVISD